MIRRNPLWAGSRHDELGHGYLAVPHCCTSQMVARAPVELRDVLLVTAIHLKYKPEKREGGDGSLTYRIQGLEAWTTHYGASGGEVLHRGLEAEVDGLRVLADDETPARIVTASEEEVVGVGGH